MSRQALHIGALSSDERYSLAYRFLVQSLELRGEASIMASIKCALLGPRSEAVFVDEIPLCVELDTLAFEFSVHSGRADISIFHVDGTASVIEVKDGTHGHQHVLSGIGQVGLYALEMGMSSGRMKHIRKALMWTSVGDVEQDSKIALVCEQAGVIAVPWASLAKHREIGRSVMEGRF